MNPNTLRGLDESQPLTDVHAEQLRVLNAAVPSSLASVLIVSLVISTVLWDVIGQATVLYWFAVTNLLSAIRLWLYLQFRRQQANSLDTQKWHRLAIVTGVASGVTWGAAGFLLFAEDSLVHQIFLGFVIAGLCAGAITTLSAVLGAARGFVLCALLPIIVKFNLVDSAFAVEMTIMTLLFSAMILISAQRLNQTIVESLEVRHQRELAEITIRRQAHFDDLTNLPNRRLLLSTLRQELAKADRHKRFGAVFFIDLDRFKAINDALGHAVGDELLVQVAQRIAHRLRREDTVGRLGGDEFVALLPEVGRDRDAAGSHATRIADAIREQFETPFVIQGHEIHLTVSIGIALFPAAVEAEDLLKFADVAMYRAKNEGRDAVRLFSNEMQDAVNRQRHIEKGLRQALGEGEFELYFQQQCNVDGHITGAETLLRWNHPDSGLLTPAAFIEVAEHTGLIVGIGEWVLQTACAHLAQLPAPLRLAVNVSPRQFIDTRFVENMQRIIDQTGIDPRRLVIEITENLAMANIEHTIATIDRLKKLGLTFSVDDFGTGYSSLNYLHRLPVDELKIDQSFVRNLSPSSDNAVIVDTIIAMAQKLDLDIVAEGIESAAELDYLKSRHCNLFQGYYFSRPEPFAAFVDRTKA